MEFSNQREWTLCFFIIFLPVLVPFLLFSSTIYIHCVVRLSMLLFAKAYNYSHMCQHGCKSWSSALEFSECCWSKIVDHTLNYKIFHVEYDTSIRNKDTCYLTIINIHLICTNRLCRIQSLHLIPFILTKSYRTKNCSIVTGSQWIEYVAQKPNQTRSISLFHFFNLQKPLLVVSSLFFSSALLLC